MMDAQISNWHFSSAYSYYQRRGSFWWRSPLIAEHFAEYINRIVFMFFFTSSVVVVIAKKIRYDSFNFIQNFCNSFWRIFKLNDQMNLSKYLFVFQFYFLSLYPLLLANRSLNIHLFIFSKKHLFYCTYANIL